MGVFEKLKWDTNKTGVDRNKVPFVEADLSQFFTDLERNGIYFDVSVRKYPKNYIIYYAMNNCAGYDDHIRSSGDWRKIPHAEFEAYADTLIRDELYIFLVGLLNEVLPPWATQERTSQKKQVQALPVPKVTPVAKTKAVAKPKAVQHVGAIQTTYNGYIFRSLLELRWAVFFDTLGIEYLYEPDGYEFDDGTRYLPDFYLPQVDLFAEVKPARLKFEELYKCWQLCKHTNSNVLLLEGAPDHKSYGLLTSSWLLTVDEAITTLDLIAQSFLYFAPTITNEELGLFVYEFCLRRHGEYPNDVELVTEYLKSEQRFWLCSGWGNYPEAKEWRDAYTVRTSGVSYTYAVERARGVRYEHASGKVIVPNE